MSNNFMSPFHYIGSLIKKFEISNSFSDLSANTELQRHLDVNHKISFVQHDEEQHIIAGAVTLGISVSLATENHEKEYRVNIEIEGCFYVPEQTGNEVFIKMLLNNGIATVYSIARGFIQGTTAQTLLGGSVLLPMFNVAEYSKAATSDQEKADE